MGIESYKSLDACLLVDEMRIDDDILTISMSADLAYMESFKPEHRVVLIFESADDERFLSCPPYKYAYAREHARFSEEGYLEDEAELRKRWARHEDELSRGHMWYFQLYKLECLFQWQTPIDEIKVTFCVTDYMGRPVPEPVAFDLSNFKSSSYAIERVSDVSFALKRIIASPDLRTLGIRPNPSWRARICQAAFATFSRFPVKRDRVLIMSARGEELADNLLAVNEELQRRYPDLDYRYVMGQQWYKSRHFLQILHYYWLYATSGLVIVDDFATPTDLVRKRPETYLVQLWHACGAFKTVGFGRFGRTGGPGQLKLAHRQYDLVPLSSKNIIEIYAEAFGLPRDRFICTGLPRIDKYLDEGYRGSTKTRMYELLPEARSKKVYLFAPTFRGNGIKTAHYPQEMFPVAEIARALPEDGLLLIKSHPFIKASWDIPSDAKDKVLDITRRNDFETNDLLLIVDRLITDYSSIIYEASLFDIPMAFYVYDLNDYFADRSIYFSFEDYAPGVIDTTLEELLATISTDDFEEGKLEKFKADTFGEYEGHATQEVVDAIAAGAKLGNDAANLRRRK